MTIVDKCLNKFCCFYSDDMLSFCNEFELDCNNGKYGNVDYKVIEGVINFLLTYAQAHYDHDYCSEIKVPDSVEPHNNGGIQLKWNCGTVTVYATFIIDFQELPKGLLLIRDDKFDMILSIPFNSISFNPLILPRISDFMEF